MAGSQPFFVHLHHSHAQIQEQRTRLSLFDFSGHPKGVSRTDDCAALCSALNSLRGNPCPFPAHGASTVPINGPAWLVSCTSPAAEARCVRIQAPSNTKTRSPNGVTSHATAPARGFPAKGCQTLRVLIQGSNFPCLLFSCHPALANRANPQRSSGVADKSVTDRCAFLPCTQCCPASSPVRTINATLIRRQYVAATTNRMGTRE